MMPNIEDANRKNQSQILDVYISTKRKGHMVGYGIHVRCLGRMITAYGWTWGTQRTSAQMLALECVLTAIAESGQSFKAAVILRTDYLRQCLGFGRSRKIKEQYGQSTRPMKVDEDLWKELPDLWELYGKGMQMAGREDEIAELSRIERALEDRFYAFNSPFAGNTPLKPTIVLPVTEYA